MNDEPDDSSPHPKRPEDTLSDDAVRQSPPTGRTFISDGVGLILREEVPWNNPILRAALSVALGNARLTDEGAFVIVPGRNPGAYTARRIGAAGTYAVPVLTVALWEGHWIAVGPAGTEPREAFPDGRTRPWVGPVPVEALA